MVNGKPDCGVFRTIIGEVQDLLAKEEFPSIIEVRFTPDVSEGILGPGTGGPTCYIELATPLIWGIASGLRLDYVLPPAEAGFPYNGRDYAWLTWGVGYHLSEQLQVGGSIQWSYSSNPYTDGLSNAVQVLFCD